MKNFFEDTRPAVTLLLVAASVLTIAVWATIAFVLHFEF